MSGLNWSWIALAVMLPPIPGVLLAIPFWRKGEMILGSIAGTAVMFGAAFALILREYSEIERVTSACLDAGYVCWPQPSAFARYAIYAFIGLIEVLALFVVSLFVEHRTRRRDYAPEWR